MLPTLKIQTSLFASLAFVFLLAGQGSCKSNDKGDSQKLPPPKWIAHALGGWNGSSYLNCVECFESNYAAGFRYFEMDFLMTSDGAMVGIHDGQEAEFGLPNSFTLEQFKKSSIKGSTPVDESNLVNWMLTKTDWFLVTDIKSDNLRGLHRLCEVMKSQNIDCLARIIPQFYSPQEFSILEELPFNRSIFTLYRFGNDLANVRKILNENPAIWGLTVPAAWWNADYLAAIEDINRVAFVHTVNDKTEADSLLQNGVNGIYTDFLYY
jgi:glycerophosphoryl diester phosphodiesterase